MYTAPLPLHEGILAAEGSFWRRFCAGTVESMTEAGSGWSYRSSVISSASHHMSALACFPTSVSVRAVLGSHFEWALSFSLSLPAPASLYSLFLPLSPSLYSLCLSLSPCSCLSLSLSHSLSPCSCLSLSLPLSYSLRLSFSLLPSASSLPPAPSSFLQESNPQHHLIGSCSARLPEWISLVFNLQLPIYLPNGCAELIAS